MTSLVWVALAGVASASDETLLWGGVWALSRHQDAPYSVHSLHQLGFFNEESHILIDRQAEGRYLVTIPEAYGDEEIAIANGNIQVTAYGYHANHCKIESWRGVESLEPSREDLEVAVWCFDPSGDLVDTEFGIFYQDQRYWEDTPWEERSIGYLFADDPWSDWSVPDPTYQFTSGEDLYWSSPEERLHTLERTETGVYYAHLRGMASDLGVALVTAHGPNASRCTVGTWWPEEGDPGQEDDEIIVEVRCFYKDTSIDSQFSLIYTYKTGFIFPFLYGSPASAYALAINPEIKAPAEPLSDRSWSSRSATAGTIEALGEGEYLVVFSGFSWRNIISHERGILPFVTAYDQTNHYCNIRSFYPNGGHDGLEETHINVRCFDSNGVPSDSPFVVQLQSEDLWSSPSGW